MLRAQMKISSEKLEEIQLLLLKHKNETRSLTILENKLSQIDIILEN